MSQAQQDPPPLRVALQPTPMPPLSRKQSGQLPNTPHDVLPQQSSNPPTSLPSLSVDALSAMFKRITPLSSPHAQRPSPGQHLDSRLLDSVVQLVVWTTPPNSGLPWQMWPEVETRSSGFVVAKGWVLTNAHCVQDASAIRLKKRGSEEQYVGSVLHVSDECDLALVGVEDEAFWEGMTTCRFGKFPRLQDTVLVVGYPIGGTNICMTAGVVSRVDIHPYLSSRCWLLAIQIDAAINSGNSGGPAFNFEGEVVGVAFQSAKGSFNSGFIIPVTIVEHFLRDCDMNDGYGGMCDKGFNWQELENSGLKAYLGMKKEETGVLVTYIEPMSEAVNVLEDGDVVCSIDGVKISDMGTVSYHGEPVSFDILVKDKFVGDVVALDIIRGKQKQHVEYSLGRSKDIWLVPVYDRRPRPEYIIVAGLVFVTLSVSYMVDEFGRDWDERAPSQLVRTVSESREKANEEAVVLARILRAHVNDGYQRLCDMLLDEFNDVKVLNLAHLAKLVAECKENFYVFRMSNDDTIAIEREKAEDSLPEIQERHSILRASHILPESIEKLAKAEDSNSSENGGGAK